MTGEALSTGGSGAHGDLTTDGAGGLATSVGFSDAPALRTKPLPPPSFIEDVIDGPGEAGFSVLVAAATAEGGGAGTDA